MSRLDATFARLREQGRAAFVSYVMAGDPDMAASEAVLRGLPGAGADVIELGFPFSDPMAEGPAIQLASQRALASGTTLRSVLVMVARFRASPFPLDGGRVGDGGGDADVSRVATSDQRRVATPSPSLSPIKGERSPCDTPIVLMGYLNPVLSYGFDAFARDAAAAGVDGLIVVDCPPEEAEALTDALDAVGISLIRLAAPTTDDARLQIVARRTSGFVYYVSVAGVTGAKEADAAAVAPAVARVRAATGLPVAVGFGIRTPERAAAVARVADAAVVGTALVEQVAQAQAQGVEPASRVLPLAKALADAVHTARETA